MTLRRTASALGMMSLALILALPGCAPDRNDLTAPANESTQFSNRGPIVTPSANNPAIRAAMQVQNRATASIMMIDKVVGTATSVDANGQPVIKIYLEEAVDAALLPRTLEGLPVVSDVIGKLVAMKGPPGNGLDHKGIQTPPIQLGTSGGWTFDLANGFCCGGTLGSLISKGGSQYILSNYHVLEADIVNGGNGRTATTGDPVIQPALIDIGCNSGNAQEVATLEVHNSLPGNNVDAAIAKTISGMVRSDGAILGIGALSSQTVGAFVGQDVKKSGRTTGLQRSSVDGLNATVSITYEDECAGGTSFTKTFTGQIVIKNRGSKFLAGGDSGSLMVEDISSNPRAVGLLFAGSNSSAIANPIDDVLSFFGATMVGN